MNLTRPFTEGVILSYLEYLSQNGLKNCSLRNHLSILRHFFAMFNWSTVPLTTRKIHLFFRLSTLVPSTLHTFDKTRFPIQNDVIWAKPGAHIIITCSKSMQDSGKVQVVQLPSLTTLEICPIKALKSLINHINQGTYR